MGLGNFLKYLHKTSFKTNKILVAIDKCVSILNEQDISQSSSTSASSTNLLIILDAGAITGPELSKTIEFNYLSGRTAAVGSLRRLVSLITQLIHELKVSNEERNVTLQVFIDGAYFKDLIKITRGFDTSTDFYIGITDGLRQGLKEADLLDIEIIKEDQKKAH